MSLFAGFLVFVQILYVGWWLVQSIRDILRSRRILGEGRAFLTTYADFSLPTTFILLFCCAILFEGADRLKIPLNFGILGIPALFAFGAWRFADQAVWNPKSVRSARVRRLEEAAEAAAKPTQTVPETPLMPFAAISSTLAATPLVEKEAPVQTLIRLREETQG
jgi:hypothetical protein